MGNKDKTFITDQDFTEGVKSDNYFSQLLRKEFL